MLLIYRHLRIGLIAACLALGACAEKARTLHVAVVQFEAESIAAVDAIDVMRRAEIAPPRQSPAEATDQFVKNVLEFEGDITSDALPIVIDPYTVDPSKLAEIDKRWSAFLGDLRLQYTAFARIFDSIERASFTGRKAIQEAKPYIEKLTAQMAFFADSIEQHPPRLLQYRNALLAQLNLIKASNQSTEDKRQQIASWRDDWIAMEAAEAELMRATVERCVKAAIVGREIRQQIADYNNISLADIVEAINRGFLIAESITGDDYSELHARADEIIQTIKSDPIWSSVADTVLRELNGLMPPSV